MAGWFLMSSSVLGQTPLTPRRKMDKCLLPGVTSTPVSTFHHTRLNDSELRGKSLNHGRTDATITLGIIVNSHLRFIL